MVTKDEGKGKGEGTGEGKGKPEAVNLERDEPITTAARRRDSFKESDEQPEST
jgi:hypothetical protein